MTGNRCDIQKSHDLPGNGTSAANAAAIPGAATMCVSLHRVTQRSIWENRMTRPLRALLLAGLVLSILPRSTRAAEALDAFENLYGEDLKRVASKRGPDDDVALAAKLLEAAQKATKQPDFLAVLCEKAWKLGKTHATGHATAIEAMKRLAWEVPEKKAACLENIATLYQAEYNAARGADRVGAGEALIAALVVAIDARTEAGDATAAAALCRRALVVAKRIRSSAANNIQARLRGLAVRERTEKEATALEERLKADPTNAATRSQLVKLLLVDLDKPVEASRFIDEASEASMKKYVPAAAKGVEECPELACMELGDWYRGLANEAGPSAKGGMLARARGYYKRLLELHKADDLARTQTTLALEKVDEALEKLAPAGRDASTASSAGWVDLLRLVDLKRDVEDGTWERKDDGILVLETAWSPRCAIPVSIEGSYRLQVEFTALERAQYVAVCFPVGQATCQWGVEWSKNTLSVNRAERAEGKLKLAKGRKYVAEITVTGRAGHGEITVTVDGQPAVRWEGKASDFALPKGRGPDSRPLKLRVTNTRALFTALRVKLIAGKFKPVRSGKK